MLSSVFKRRGLDLLSNSDLNDLVKPYDTSKQKKDNMVSWNLDIVLKWLTGPSFELLCSTSLRNLSRKTLFLVALATAKHVSEIVAINKRIWFSLGDAVYSFTQGFLAKNEDPSKPWSHTFTIKNLMDILDSEEEERVLCPVKALRYYLNREPSSNLWCLVKNLSLPLSKNVLSFFLRDLMSVAHLDSRGYSAYLQSESSLPFFSRPTGSANLSSCLTIWKKLKLCLKITVPGPHYQWLAWYCGRNHGKHCFSPTIFLPWCRVSSFGELLGTLYLEYPRVLVDGWWSFQCRQLHCLVVFYVGTALRARTLVYALLVIWPIFLK